MLPLPLASATLEAATCSTQVGSGRGEGVGRVEEDRDISMGCMQFV